MRTRNSRSGDEIKTAKECNHNRVTRSDAKLKEAELKLKKDCELEKEKVVAEPISRETRSRSRGSKDEVVSETKNDKSKSFSSNLNISSTMEQMIDGFSVTSGPPNPIISKKSTVLSDELIISSPMASTSNSHDNNEIENNTKSSANTSKSSVLTADSIINDRDQQDKISCSGKIKILIAVTGSVASIKLIELISTLRSKFPILNHQTPITIDIKIIMTENAKHFTAPDKIFETFNNSIEVHDDKQEWNTWTKMGDEILHIELRKWADIFLIAPLDANTMGKMANGICDNLLTCTARAWDTSKPLIFCPAMNVHMYEHPMTKEHIYKLQSFGYIKIDCIAKRLACGDVGMGAMASVDTIVERLVRLITDISSCRRRHADNNSLDHNTSSTIYQEKSSLDSQVPDRLNHNNNISIYSSRPKIDLPPVQDFDLNSARKRRRKSNPDGSDELNDDRVSTVHPNNIGFFGPRFSTVNSLSVTIPSLRNNRPSLGLNHSISIKPKASFSNSLLVQQPRIISQIGSIRPKINTYSQSGLKIIPSSERGPTFVNQKRLIHLSTNGEEHKSNQLLIKNCEKKSNADSNHTTDIHWDIRQNKSQSDSEEVADFDPSKLLEQTMITDEAILVNHFSKDEPAQRKVDEERFNSGTSLLHKQELEGSPLIDTQKFLSMCYLEDENVFKCAICKNLYKTRKSMSRHLKEQHVDGPIFSCERCNVSYKRKEKLIKHMREKHEATNDNFEQFINE